MRKLEKLQLLLAWVLVGFLVFLGINQLWVQPYNSAFYIGLAAIICPRNPITEEWRLIAATVIFTVGLILGTL